MTNVMTKNKLISEIAETTNLDNAQIASVLNTLTKIANRDDTNGAIVSDILNISTIGATNNPKDSTFKKTPTSDVGSIVFACQKCGSMISTPSSSTGKTAECPFCSEDVKVPEIGSNKNRNENSAGKPESTNQPEEEEFVTFFCEGCGQEIESAKSTAGSTASCPTCGSQLTIPESSTPPPAPVADNDNNASPSMTMRIDLLDL